MDEAHVIFNIRRIDLRRFHNQAIEIETVYETESIEYGEGKNGDPELSQLKDPNKAEIRFRRSTRIALSDASQLSSQFNSKRNFRRGKFSDFRTKLPSSV
jgi:hypothetical protein